MRGTSSNFNESSPRRASNTRFPIRKETPARSSRGSQRSLLTKNPTSPESESVAMICPLSISGFPPFVTMVSLKEVLDFFHISNLANASSEEAIFLHVLYGSLATQARLLAAILPGPVQRPLRALLAAMRESGKSYTKRSATHKPLSNSPASSRKRS
jgi:hypothetical protein